MLARLNSWLLSFAVLEASLLVVPVFRFLRRTCVEAGVRQRSLLHLPEPRSPCERRFWVSTPYYDVSCF